MNEKKPPGGRGNRSRADEINSFLNACKIYKIIYRFNFSDAGAL